MANHITTTKGNKSLQPLLEELKEVKYYLKKLLTIIPQESLKEYKNSSAIKRAYLDSLKSFAPSKNEH